MTEQLIERLKSLAKRKCWSDKLNTSNDCIINDLAGGNIDDAYDGGYNSGEIGLAREVLRSLGIEYK